MTAARGRVASTRLAWLAVLLLLVAAALSACGGAGTGGGQGSAVSAPLGSGQAGDYRVSVSTNPGPPTTGTVAIDALVTDSSGNPVTDAAVTFDLDMTNMHMGRNVVTAAPNAGGHYVGDISLMMSGPWRVIVGIARGGAQSSVQIDFVVQ